MSMGELAREPRTKQHLQVNAPLLDEQVLTFREWCALNGISLRTGRRILAGANGPTVVRLSARLIGVTVRANREWQQSRARGAVA
jgi:hypothetical protein